jgi:hypothetical protein
VVVFAQIFTADEIRRHREESIAGAAEKMTLRSCAILLAGEGR